MKTREFLGSLYSKAGLVVIVAFNADYVEPTKPWEFCGWKADETAARVAGVIFDTGELLRREDATPSQEGWLAAFDSSLRSRGDWLKECEPMDNQLAKLYKVK